MTRKYQFFIIFLLVILVGCAMPQQQPPKQAVTPNFNFEPTSSATSKLGMTIAIIKPQSKGTMFSDVLLNSGTDMRRVAAYTNDMLKAAKADMEKILIAKGFNILGPFESIDEMTFSEKERASLIYAPVFEANMDFMGGDISRPGVSTYSQNATVNMRGSVSLAFLEPMTREKVWMKRFDIEPSSEPYVASVQSSPSSGLAAEIVNALMTGGSQGKNTQVEASVLTLNNFYQKAMNKMWDHLDPREIQSLKAEATKLKGMKRY